MSNQIEYGFWFWKENFPAILTMLAALSKYEIDEEEFEIIKQDLRGTNNDRNEFLNYTLNGKLYELKLRLAYDGDNNDIAFITITTNKSLRDKLEALDLFQSLFRNLEPAFK